mmetsp:Transcript_8785/g.9819  ORF Transcript_8785/g.9819 Transcript_8785/m.9819 type:complete len:123 (-) Transcript_8785:151-519(-)
MAMGLVCNTRIREKFGFDNIAAFFSRDTDSIYTVARTPYNNMFSISSERRTLTKHHERQYERNHQQHVQPYEQSHPRHVQQHEPNHLRHGQFRELNHPQHDQQCEQNHLRHDQQHERNRRQL